MALGLKRLVVGRTISSSKLEHQLLPKLLALPVFSSDPLSSVAYATEEMMLVLVLAGAASLSLMLPIGFAIAITSAFPGALSDHKVAIALVLVLLVTLANLRGVKEAGRLFAFPTYGFV